MPDATLNYTAAGWPYLDDQNYIDIIDNYTLELANKLQNSDADVAAAINAAQRAETAAATAVAAAARMAAGKVFITPVPNTPTAFALTFPAGRFTATPFVVATADSSGAGTQIVEVTVSSVSSTGCTLNLNRTNATNTGVMWIAVQL